MLEKHLTTEEKLKIQLSGNGCTLCCAESCTGGNIAHRITEVSGSSEYFIGGVVSYAARIKNQLLGVSLETIDACGIVSAEVASEMAEGVRKALDCTYSVATTGWADAYGDEHESAGTVWIAVSGPGGTETLRYHSDGPRKTNIERFSTVALNFLTDYISKYIIN